MNRREVVELRDHLSEQNPGGEVVVIPQQDGVKVVISGPGVGGGVSGPHHGTDIKICMSDDGPLMRSLLNGHL
jgi:hypothetical protein